MPLVVAAVLGLAGLAFVIVPLLGFDRAPDDAAWPVPAAELADGERLARTALREVEFDHSLGNLDDTDYSALRERYERRALAALKQRYHREQELDARIERELADLRSRDEADAARTAIQSAKLTVAERPRALQPKPSRGPRTRRRKGI